MVIPVVSHFQGSVRDLPEEAHHLLPCLKVCILILWILGLATLLTRDILFSITTLAPAIVGTFLFHEDVHLSFCYERLRHSFVGVYCCANTGLANLAPFFVVSTVNTMFLGFNLTILLLESRVSQFVDVLFVDVVQVLKLFAFVIQFISSILSYRMLKMVPLGDNFGDPFQGDVYEALPGHMLDLPRGRPSDPDVSVASGGNSSGRGASSSSGSQAASSSARSTVGSIARAGQTRGFVPFGGQGHKLTP